MRILFPDMLHAHTMQYVVHWRRRERCSNARHLPFIIPCCAFLVPGHAVVLLHVTPRYFVLLHDSTAQTAG